MDVSTLDLEMVQSTADTALCGAPKNAGAAAVMVPARSRARPTRPCSSASAGIPSGLSGSLHAVLFSAWPLYFLAQTRLAARGQVARHRAWGLLGVSLATAMVIVGIAVANDVLVTRLEAGHGDRARAFHIVSMSMMALFASFVAVAIACVSRPEVHKRLMILATVTILPPAVARLFFAVSVGIGPGLRPGGGPPRTVDGVLTSALVADLLILAAIVYDGRTRRRPHPVYVIGGAILLAVQILRGPLRTTPGWYALANWLARVAG